MSVIIRPDNHNPGEATRVAQAILALANDPREVLVDTGSFDGIAFVVSDELAAKLNLNEEAEAEKVAAKPSKKRKDS